MNGMYIWSQTGYPYPAAMSRSRNYLGKSNWAVGPYFNGAIDDFKMYSRVVLAAEAQALYSGDKEKRFTYFSILDLTGFVLTVQEA